MRHKCFSIMNSVNDGVGKLVKKSCFRMILGTKFYNTCTCIFFTFSMSAILVSLSCILQVTTHNMHSCPGISQNSSIQYFIYIICQTCVFEKPTKLHANSYGQRNGFISVCKVFKHFSKVIFREFCPVGQLFL